MKLRTLYTFLTSGSLVVLAMSSCTKDLNRQPLVQVTSEVVYNNPATIKQGLAKLYAGLSLSGQDVLANPDINTQDVGSNVFLRNFFNAQELTTDEAVIGWNDHDLQAYHNMNWTPNGYFVQLMYDRVFFEVAACNEFIRELPDSKISSFTGSDATNIKTYVNEARFLRAFAYWVGLDMFGNIPFTTEKDQVGAFFPPQASRDSVFKYVESELLDLQTKLPAPGANEYGRADQGAVWALLARLYLNAQVYTGTDRSTDCLTYCNKVISSGTYSLAQKYANIFETDNANTKEIIFPIRANGVTSQSYGNTTYIVHAEIGGSMDATQFGIVAGGGWGGLRTTSALVGLFPDPSGNTDQRAMFFTNGQTLQIKNIANFGDGYAITKFKNVSSTGVPGSDPSKTFVDTDFPLFRLADVYLMYAEAVLRGGNGGDATTALGYVNQLRQRAFGNANGNITGANLNLNFILDERGRELYWEGIRRTDLVRYGLFTSANYLWPFKGGVDAGTGVDSKYNLFPVSATDMVANPNLKQNPGY